MDAPLVFALLLGVVAGAAVARAAGSRGERARTPALELTHVAEQLHRLQATLQESERGRAEAFGMLSAHVRTAGEQTARLAETTGALREALSSGKARGQWGERMAEDVLRLAGLLEGVNYVKQSTLASGGVPDFTFLLPRGVRLHMDVKFPLDNYLRYLDADHDGERETARDRFLRDVRVCVRGLATRAYGEGPDAVDCVLLFIPNEQVFGFVQAQDPTILDEALTRKVVPCSPLTLFAVLAVVRQAADNFALERTSDEILVLLSRFAGEWERYTGELDKLGRQLDTVRRTYDELTGPRRRRLERPLEQLDELRRARGPAGHDDYASVGVSSSTPPSPAEVRPAE